MTTQLVQVPFHGDVLEAIQNDQGIWIVAKRACESLGLTWQRQHAKLTSDECAHWARVTEMVIRDSRGQEQSTQMLHIDSIPMWLVGIKLGKVRPELRDKLKLFQREAARVLKEHFTGTNANVGAPDLAGLTQIVMMLATAVRGMQQDQLQMCELMKLMIETSRKQIEAMTTSVNARQPATVGEPGQYVSVKDACDEMGWKTHTPKLRSKIRERACAKLIKLGCENTLLIGGVRHFYKVGTVILERVVRQVWDEELAREAKDAGMFDHVNERNKLVN